MSTSSDTIDPYASQLNNHPTPLNIPPFFTTDNPRWPLQPQTPQPLAPQSTRNSFFSADFELFDTPASRTALVQTERAPATSRTSPNTDSASAFTGQQSPRHSTHSHQLHSQSPVRSEGVTRVLSQSRGPSSTPQLSSYNRSTFPGPKYYPASAPSSSPNLQQHQHKIRPPVPPFSSNSTGNVHTQQHSSQLPHRRIMSTSCVPQGEFNCPEIDSTQELNIEQSDMDSFDFLNVAGEDVLFSPADVIVNDFDYSASTFSAINASAPVQRSANTGTISPKDLHKDMTFSAPQSTAFTNLSTPGSYAFDSPHMGDSSEFTSPMLADDQELDTSFWPPLFTDGDAFAPSNPQTDASPHVGSSSSLASPMVRTKSSPGKSPTSHGRKHSTTSGVNPRKPSKPLAPVPFNPGDDRDKKRARNTEAARKSRAKKLEYVQEMEAKIEALEEERDYWKSVAHGEAPQ